MASKNRPMIRTVVRVAAVAVVAAGILVLARELTGCTPPRDQADMIELFEADPLADAVPQDGELVAEHSHSHACDSAWATGGSPTGPGFAEVMRLYTTPAAYDLDQLRQRFDEPAAEGGWRIDEARTLAETVVYCKQTRGRTSYAYVSSRTYSETVDDPAVRAVQVRVSAGRHDDDSCGVANGGR